MIRKYHADLQNGQKQEVLCKYKFYPRSLNLKTDLIDKNLSMVSRTI